MTPSQLKYNYEKAHEGLDGGHYFCRQSMNFFGDTMRNYGCKGGGDVWILWRKIPVRGGVSRDTWFCKKTFRIVPQD